MNHVYINNVYRTVAAMLFGIAATCLFSACSDDDGHSAEEKEKPSFEVSDSRTVMFYIAGDNSLSSNVMADFSEIVRGFNKYDYGMGNRVVAFVDDKRAPRIYALDNQTRGKGYAELTPVKTYASDVNSASAEVLSEFVKYVQTNYPAQSYGLVLGSHGFGWIPSYVEVRPYTRAFGQDTNTGGGEIGMGTDEIADVLADVSGLDFIFFDACFMQTIEVDCDLKDVTKHIIASPAEVPNIGADYSVTLPEMFRRDGYAEGICESYSNSYANDPNGEIVISDVNTAALNGYVSYMKNVVGSKLCENDMVNVDDLFSYHVFVAKSAFYPDMPDMKSVMSHLLDEKGFAEWSTQIEKVVKCWHGTTWFDNWRKLVLVDADQCSGVSMFVPRSMYDQRNLYFNYYFKQTRWAKAVLPSLEED